MTAALLVADETVPHDARGLVPEIAWAALDCPSYVPALWDADVPSLLARMHAELLEPIPIGEPIVATGWLLGPRAASTDRQRAAGRRRATARPREAPVGQAPRGG